MYTIILDLDCTLLHSVPLELVENNPMFFSFYKQLKYKNNVILLRPYLKEFLTFCKQRYSIGIWTSNSEEYTNFIIDHIFNPLDIRLKFVLTYNDCMDCYNLHFINKCITYIEEKFQIDVNTSFLLDDDHELILANEPFALHAEPFVVVNKRNTSCKHKHHFSAFEIKYSKLENVEINSSAHNDVYLSELIDYLGAHYF